MRVFFRRLCVCVSFLPLQGNSNVIMWHGVCYTIDAKNFFFFRLFMRACLYLFFGLVTSQIAEVWFILKHACWCVCRVQKRTITEKCINNALWCVCIYFLVTHYVHAASKTSLIWKTWRECWYWTWKGLFWHTFRMSYDLFNSVKYSLMRFLNHFKELFHHFFMNQWN